MESNKNENEFAELNVGAYPSDYEQQWDTAKANWFLESVYELQIELSKDITEDSVNSAYMACIKDYLSTYESGVLPAFKIGKKEAAKDYLIHFLKKRKVEG